MAASKTRRMMTSRIYRGIIRRLGLSNREVASWLGINLNSAYGYKSGALPIPRNLSRILRMIEYFKLTSEEAKKIWGKERRRKKPRRRTLPGVWRRKLTADQCREAVERRVAGESLRAIAYSLGVSPSTIANLTAMVPRPVPPERKPKLEKKLAKIKKAKRKPKKKKRLPIVKWEKMSVKAKRAAWRARRARHEARLRSSATVAEDNTAGN